MQMPFTNCIFWTPLLWFFKNIIPSLFITENLDAIPANSLHSNIFPFAFLRQSNAFTYSMQAALWFGPERLSPVEWPLTCSLRARESHAVFIFVLRGEKNSEFPMLTTMWWQKCIWSSSWSATKALPNDLKPIRPNMQMQFDMCLEWVSKSNPCSYMGRWVCNHLNPFLLL